MKRIASAARVQAKPTTFCSFFPSFPQAGKIKDEGTELFKEKRFKEALEKYEEAQEYVEHDEAVQVRATTTSSPCHFPAPLSRIPLSPSLQVRTTPPPPPPCEPPFPLSSALAERAVPVAPPGYPTVVWLFPTPISFCW